MAQTIQQPTVLETIAQSVSLQSADSQNTGTRSGNELLEPGDGS